ncbi:hypothetical protein NGRA_2481 [Nosema granulosis]|uniref:Uncharacterized protein n=1 Tax=Nosema granulosis TaxID=83296 RepID=A0A9P6KY58_9MICR|nr:hypothetical protein NGRA_2481 [Nosema granulosis]
MHLTTTEKLLVAMAYGLYGEDKMDLIHSYLRYNGVEIDSKVICDTHKKLIEESKTNGYTDILSYCEDERYAKAVEIYNTYKQKLFDVLEDKIESQECDASSSEEFFDVRAGSYNKTTRSTVIESTMVLGSFIDLENVKINNENQLQIEPKTINRVITKPARIESATSLKDKKRFYWKLTEEEKLIDDYFDILDERVDVKVDAICTEENPFYIEFPAVNDIKRENKDNCSLEISDDKIRGQFDLIINKISSVRKQDKDKSLWKDEIKVLLDYIVSVIAYKKVFTEIYNKIEMNSLSQIVIMILLQLQDIIIENEDSELISTCGVLKKYVSAFYDYYKK